jgi:hypothetical protein
MNELPTIRGAVRWALRQWRARLRSDGAAIALLVLMLFGVGEPLLCIAHCYLWLPVASPSSVATHHHHLGATNAQPAAASLLTTDVVSVLPAGENPTPACYLHNGTGQDSNDPFSISPQPFHEMVPPLLLLLIPLLLIISRLVVPPGDGPRVFIRPPLRPPIYFAR